MDNLPLPFSHDSAVFDFSELPVSSGTRPVMAPGPATVPDPESDGLELRPILRKLFPWISAQVVAALGLGTCLAQAMPPVPSKPMLGDDMNFALRLSEASEAIGPVPHAIRDGFHLRIGSID
jgi:hypothetical protein